MTGEKIIESMRPMHERSNGLGGGFAGYGIYPEYKDLFLQKLGKVFKTFTTQYMLDVLEPLVALITPEMELHWARWGEENDKMVIAEVPTTVDGAYRYWEKRVERLRNVLRKRPTYLWEMIQNTFQLSGTQMIQYFGEQPEMPADAV